MHQGIGYNIWYRVALLKGALKTLKNVETHHKEVSRLIRQHYENTGFNGNGITDNNIVRSDKMVM